MIVLDLENVRFTLENDEVQTTSKKKVPPYLYKYYSLDENNYKSLRDKTLFFSHPHHLNDVMDGSFLLWDLDHFEKEFKKDTKNTNLNLFYERLKFVKCFTKNIGILSLSSDSINHLMWPHYTKEKGYCLEFNTSNLLNHLNNLKDDNVIEIYFYPVSYQSYLSQIDFESISTKHQTDKKITRNANLAILYAHSIKDRSWKYEDEWRFLMRNSNFEYVNAKAEFSSIIKTKNEIEEENKKRCISIGNDIIEKIILGQFFFSTDRFAKMEVTLNDIEIFYFNKETEKNKNQLKILKKFLKILFEQYNQKIYLIDNYIDQNKEAKRDIKYKVEILEVTESDIKVKRTLGSFKVNP